MLQLSLTPNEAEALAEALASYVSDLRLEVADTESQDLREQLKSRELLLTRVLERLPSR